MALSIKSDDADCLARDLASTTGEPLTEAVLVALRERLDRERSRRGTPMSTRLRRLASNVAALPIVDARSPEKIVGYDRNGLPG